jgi:hypothetical protein
MIVHFVLVLNKNYNLKLFFNLSPNINLRNIKRKRSEILNG